MDFDLSDLGVAILLVIMAISIMVAIIVVTKSFKEDAKESKARAARIAKEENIIADELGKPATKKAAVKPSTLPPHKDDVHEGDDLVEAAEVYLTYELKEQAITSLEKHLLKNPTDKKALALLKRAEASE